ncbi:hypothetical protein HDU85_007350 [Gaertneriomyces sp. JEL0708]|nr:hypothetical protein HDU85_007350 [Gaertneriomyces sp. JEL0708]
MLSKFQCPKSVSGFRCSALVFTISRLVASQYTAACSIPGGLSMTCSRANHSSLPTEARFDNVKCSFTLPKELATKYELSRFLGAGAFTEVFQGRDRQTGKEYAIKFLPKDDFDPSLPYSFEAETAPHLNHPHIIRYFDSFDTPQGATPAALCIVMELFGHRIRDYMDTYGSPSTEQALQWTKQLASALAYLHGRGIRHGDVRPSNIHVDGSIAKLVDLGFARHVGGQGEDPQQVLEEDVQGLGRVLLEMLIGRVTKDGEFDKTHIEGLRRLGEATDDTSKRLSGILHNVFEGPTPSAEQFRAML